MIASTTLLNRIRTELARDVAVHSMTDVTGFGLLGHALEMARGSNIALFIRTSDLPLLSEAQFLAQQRFVTGASARNWASYGESEVLPPDLSEWRHLLTDPQTSGGLLVACAPVQAEAILSRIVAAGYPHARIIGHADTGAPSVVVEA